MRVGTKQLDLLWSDHKVVLCRLSDDVYKRSRLLRVRACLQLHLWAGWDGSTDAQKQAHWQEHYRTFYATNSCGKEAKADEVLSLFEVRNTPLAIRHWAAITKTFYIHACWCRHGASDIAPAK